MNCPHCHARLLQKSDGKLKVRVPILVFSIDGESCVTSCPGCRKEISLPVTLQKSALPVDAPTKLILRR